MAFFINEADDLHTRIEKFRAFVRFVILGFITLVCLQLIATIMNFYSVADRRAIHEQQAQIVKMQADLDEKTRQNDIMLAGRKGVQVSIVTALTRANLFDQNEKKIIGMSWRFTKYDGASNPFPEFER